MIRKHLLLLFLLLQSLALLVGADAAIWSVVHEQLPGKIYLVGSVHAGKSSMYPLDQVYDRILSEADFLVFEIADQEKSKMEAALFASRKGLYRNSPEVDLLTELGKPDFKKLAVLVAMPEARLRLLRPWVASGLLELTLAKKHGIVPEYGLENLFLSNAGSRQKIGLESTVMQMNLLSGKDLEPELLKSLSETVKDPAATEKVLLACTALIEEGDLEPLRKEQEKDRMKFPLLYEKLFIKRNRNMAQQILHMMKNRRTGLVIVGAGHFIGEDSVVELMRKEGCTVVRLPLTGKKGNLKIASQSERNEHVEDSGKHSGNGGEHSSRPAPETGR